MRCSTGVRHESGKSLGALYQGAALSRAAEDESQTALAPAGMRPAQPGLKPRLFLIWSGTARSRLVIQVRQGPRESF
jgi:hypothetical protein